MAKINYLVYAYHRSLTLSQNSITNCIKIQIFTCRHIKYRYRILYRLGFSFCMIHAANFGNIEQCVQVRALLYSHPYLFHCTLDRLCPLLLSYILCDYIYSMYLFCFEAAFNRLRAIVKIRRMGVAFQINILIKTYLQS